MNVRTTLSASPSLPIHPGPLTVCASHLEDQFSRVVARQNMQGDELASLNTDVADLQTQMRAMTLTSAPTSPPVPAVHAKLERERARLRASELGAAKETADNGKPRLALMHAPGEPSTPTFEARMNEHGAQLRALTAAVETLASEVTENTQLNRPDQMAAQMAEMNRWCERFSALHERTLARCSALEDKLGAANAETSRLKEGAANAEIARLNAAKPVAQAQLENDDDDGKETPPRATPLPHRQLAAVRHVQSTQNTQGSAKARNRHGGLNAPSLPALPPNSPFSFSL